MRQTSFASDSNTELWKRVCFSPLCWKKINGGDFCKSPVFDTGLCTFSLCEPVSLSGYKNSQEIAFLFQAG